MEFESSRSRFGTDSVRKGALIISTEYGKPGNSGKNSNTMVQSDGNFSEKGNTLRGIETFFLLLPKQPQPALQALGNKWAQERKGARRLKQPKFSVPFVWTSSASLE